MQEDVLLQNRGANFYGIERIDSAGKRHYQIRAIRGNGDLTLTNRGVHFIRCVPRAEYFIPIDKITRVDWGRFHNLRTRLLPVLKIYYKEDGDTLVFGVCIGRKQGTLAWQRAIEGIISRDSVG